MALITKQPEFKQYIAMDVNTSMETLQPFIDEAEQLFIKDLLGVEFYEELKAAYSASVAEEPEELSEELAALLPYVQRSLAYYTQLLSIPHLSVTFGDMGTREHRADDSTPAPKWKEDKLLFNSLKNGDIHAEKLLAFLEENSADYPTWEASDANTSRSGYLVYNTVIASRHIIISESRRIFLQLRSTMNQLEKRFIPKLIGQAQYDELVAAIQSGDELSEAQQEITDRLEAIICKRALFIRLPFMRVSITQDGLWLTSDGTDLRNAYHIATQAEIKSLRMELMDGDLGYLADERELNQFIVDNIADYPLIEATAVYTVKPDPGPTWTAPSPSPDSKWFAT
jgi:hypothetical protein